MASEAIRFCEQLQDFGVGLLICSCNDTSIFSGLRCLIKIAVSSLFLRIVLLSWPLATTSDFKMKRVK
jgi:hypothetical protein